MTYDNGTHILDTLSKLPTWSENKESALLEPYTYITSFPGKGIRKTMIKTFNKWLNVPDDKLKTIIRIVNMLHSASLLVDDIEDESQLRRGQPVAHRIYGTPQTINTANYVYFLAYQELFSLRSCAEISASQTHNVSSVTSATEDFTSSEPDRSAGTQRLSTGTDLYQIVTAELLCLHRGQGLEILWRDSLQCPTEEEYIGMVNDKTGGLFRIAIRLMMAWSTTNRDIDYVPLVNAIGVYFQIRDDYMNLQSPQYTNNKGFAEDLTEGKFSFPVIHGICADTSNRRVLNVLHKRSTSRTLKTHTISYLKDHTKSFDYTLSVLHTLEKHTRNEIQKLGGNVQLEGIIDELHIEAI